jgi:hypothetical protein
MSASQPPSPIPGSSPTSGSSPIPSSRRGPDWTAIAALATSVVAMVGLVFTVIQTNKQLGAANTQLRINKEGQITDRFNVAITNLGSSSIAIRMGGIYALQSIMQDSQPEQLAVVEVLSAFIRVEAPAKLTTTTPSADVQAALTVLGTRDPSHDGAGVVDLAYAHLSGAMLAGAHFDRALLTGVQLQGAHLERAELRHALLNGAALTGTFVAGADFTGACFNNSHRTGWKVSTATKGLPPNISPHCGLTLTR